MSTASSFFPCKALSNSSRWILEDAFLCSDMCIKDDQGKRVFRAASKFFSPHLDFIDLSTGLKIGKIQQTSTFGMPKFTIFLGDVEYGVVKQCFTWFTMEFKVVRRSFNNNNERKDDGEKEKEEEEILVSGNWMNNSFVFKRATSGQTIASMETAFFKLYYTVHIEPVEEVLFILACCIVIVNCIKRRRRQQTNRSIMSMNNNTILAMNNNAGASMFGQ